MNLRKLVSGAALCGILATGTTLCTDVPKPILSDYRDNIIYQDFSKIDFDAIPKEKVAVPEDLIDNLRNPKVEDRELLEDLILAEAAKFDVQPSQMRNLSPRQAIMLSMNVAASRLTYKHVDSDKDFIAIYGENLPIEQYMAIGKGDCDKYAHVAIEAFRLIKKQNPSLKNIYISNSNLGAMRIGHDWNAIYIIHRNKIVVTNLDPTFYDAKDNKFEDDKLEANRGYHIAEDDDVFRAKLFEDVEDYDTSYRFYEKAVSKSTDDVKKRAIVLSDMIYVAYELADEAKVNAVRNLYLNLNTVVGQKKILRYSRLFEKEHGDVRNANAFKMKLQAHAAKQGRDSNE